MKRRLLQAAYHKLSPEWGALSHTLILELIDWSQNARAGDRRDISGALQMRASYETFIIEAKDLVDEQEQYRLIPRATDRRLVMGAPLVHDRLTIGLSPGWVAGAPGFNLRLPARLELRLRTRQPGDRFKPRGMGGRSRKLKSWMIDRKIPRAIRDRIPLICADGEVIAICCGDIWHLAEIAPCDSRDASAVTLSLS